MYICICILYNLVINVREMTLIWFQFSFEHATGKSPANLHGECVRQRIVLECRLHMYCSICILFNCIHTFADCELSLRSCFCGFVNVDIVLYYCFHIVWTWYFQVWLKDILRTSSGNSEDVHRTSSGNSKEVLGTSSCIPKGFLGAPSGNRKEPERHNQETLSSSAVIRAS